MNAIKKFLLSLKGIKFVGMRTKMGWYGELPFFRVRCKRCDSVFEDYPQGFNEDYFTCPHCGKTRFV